MRFSFYVSVAPLSGDWYHLRPFDSAEDAEQFAERHRRSGFVVEVRLVRRRPSKPLPPRRGQRRIIPMQ